MSKPPVPGPSSGNRKLKERVKTARKRKPSSTRWLARQLNDPYVAAAKKDGYRSRAAYKLLEIDQKVSLLKPGMRVVDLGAAPGGWTQIAVAKTGSSAEHVKVVALDILPMKPVKGAHCLECDFNDENAPDLIREKLQGQIDVVMSDIAPNTTGHGPTDHLRMMGLVELAFDFACNVLTPGGCFVAKVFQGGTEQAMLKEMKRVFGTVKHVKPKASRSDSSETYVVATKYRG